MAVRLFWWQEKRKDGRENYGDLMSKYLAEKISKQNVITVSHPSKFKYKYLYKHVISIGSIISSANKNSIVWGSGIISKDEIINKSKFLAVRGPKTRKRVLENGYNCPEKYGDPALLMPNYFKNKIEKKYSIGIIPHYVDYKAVNSRFKKDSQIKVVDLLTNNVEKTTSEILECNSIISSSLHGVIVSQSYGIPALWVKFSDKLFGDNIKFYDYYESVGISFKNEIFLLPEVLNKSKIETLLEENSTVLLADKTLLELRKKELVQSCPY